LRTPTQKYSVTDKVRQRFATTERDEATGLDHTWFRKYDSFAGRWTSPDPFPEASPIRKASTITLMSQTILLTPSARSDCIPSTLMAPVLRAVRAMSTSSPAPHP